MKPCRGCKYANGQLNDCHELAYRLGMDPEHFGTDYYYTEGTILIVDEQPEDRKSTMECVSTYRNHSLQYERVEDG